MIQATTLPFGYGQKYEYAKYPKGVDEIAWSSRWSIKPQPIERGNRPGKVRFSVDWIHRDLNFNVAREYGVPLL